MGLLRAVLRHPSGRIGAAVILIFLILAGLGAVGLTPHNPLKQYIIDRLKPPSATYWFGTDLLGRDQFSRLMLGIGESFLIAFTSVAIAATAGALIGLFAAWWGHLWDGVLMRIMDVLLAFPAILLALLIVAIQGPGVGTSITAIGIVYTPIFARVVRAPALALKAREFVEAARTFGSSQGYILSRHLLLNLVAPLTVTITLALAWSLLTESGLSFLGLGSQPPAPSLGVMLAESKSMMTRAPWLMVFPGLTIMLAILGFNLLGDALRDILDPRTQERAA
jgi:peptide/nickel transport system permease protein